MRRVVSDSDTGTWLHASWQTKVVRVEGLGANKTVRALGPDTVEAACADPERFWWGGEPGIARDDVLETELAPYGLLFIHQSRS